MGMGSQEGSAPKKERYVPRRGNITNVSFQPPTQFATLVETMARLIFQGPPHGLLVCCAEGLNNCPQSIPRSFGPERLCTVRCSTQTPRLLVGESVCAV